MSTVYHLPAIVIRDQGEDHQIMVAACGKRGPIRARETGVGAQLELGREIAGGRSCAECEVRWDAAEQTGAIVVRWLSNASRSWAAAGAVLWKKRPEPYRCVRCGRKEDSSSFRPDSMAVVVREVRASVHRVAA